MSVPRFDFPYGGRPLGADSPDLLPEPQPKPLETRVSRMKVAGRWVTALWRAWSYDDIPTCRLCARGRCSAVGGSCMFQVDAYISDAEAPLYQIAGTKPSP